jgi:hypothetical protein
MNHEATAVLSTREYHMIHAGPSTRLSEPTVPEAWMIPTIHPAVGFSVARHQLLGDLTSSVGPRKVRLQP